MNPDDPERTRYRDPFRDPTLKSLRRSSRRHHHRPSKTGSDGPHLDRIRVSRRALLGPGCLAAWLALIALIALMLTPPPVPPPPTPAVQARAEVRMAAVKQEMAAVEADAKANRPHPFAMRVTEEEINTYLATSEAAQDVLAAHRIERAFVRILDGQVRATAFRRVEGLSVAGTATVVPHIHPDHTLDFRIEKLDIGRLGLPRVATRRVAQEVVRALHARAANPLVKYRAIRIEDDALILDGDTR